MRKPGLKQTFPPSVETEKIGSVEAQTSQTSLRLGRGGHEDRVKPPVSELPQLGRDCYQRRRWGDAFDALSRADEIEPLAAADLWLLAWSAHLTGRDEDFARIMGRAYRAYLDEDEFLHAARCAGWLGAMLGLAGESGPGVGWLSRAQRLIERESIDCPERGFLILSAAFDHAEAGE